MKYGDSFARDMFVRDLILCNHTDSTGDIHTEILFRRRPVATNDTYVLAKLVAEHYGGIVDEKGCVKLYINEGDQESTPSLAMTWESGMIDFHHVGDNVMKLSTGMTGSGDKLRVTNDDESVDITLYGSAHSSPSLFQVTSANFELDDTSVRLFGTDPTINGEDTDGVLSIRNRAGQATEYAQLQLFGNTHASTPKDIQASGERFSIMSQDPSPVPLFQVDTGTSVTKINTQEIEMNPDIYFDRSNSVASGTLYFGDDTQNGTIRIHVQDSGIQFQRREAGVWVPYHTFAVS